jgi:hypothetical protein
MTHPLRTLFACWLAVATTGAVVSHRHEGAPGHTHGWGWFRAAPSSAPDKVFLPHRHIVLLGIETGAIPDGTDSGGSDAPAQVVPVFESSFPGGGETASSPDGPSVAAPIVTRLDALANAPGGVPASISSRPLVVQTRSAVLRL